MKKLPLFFGLMAFPVLLSAQNTVDFGMFTDAAQEYLGLYRGELPLHYGSKSPNDGSTFFAYSTDFENGDVLFRGKHYKGVTLNLNVHIDELYVRDPFQGIAILVNKNFVDSFSMGRRRFVHHKQEQGSMLANGYYEVLYEGRLKLFKKIRKNYFENTLDGQRLKKGFTLDESFYLWKDDRWVRVAAKKDLQKLYPDQKRNIDQIVKTGRLDFSKNNREHALTVIVTHFDAL